MDTPFNISVILLCAYHRDIIMILQYDIGQWDCNDTIVCLSQCFHYDLVVAYLYGVLITAISLWYRHYDIITWDCSDSIVYISQWYHNDPTIPFLCNTVMCLSQRYHFDIPIRYLCMRLHWYHCVPITVLISWSQCSISLRYIVRLS